MTIILNNAADQAVVDAFEADRAWAEAYQIEADRIPPAPERYENALGLGWRNNVATVHAVARLAVGVALIALFCVAWSAFPA